MLPWKICKYCITYSKCASVALGIQHAQCMHRFILSSVACLAVSYLPHYHTKGTIFRKKLLNIKRVFSFSLQVSSETFLILRRNE